MLGESRVVALEKPDKGIRPIAIGDSLARLAGKCMCRALNPTARYFTTTAADDAPAPLQLGVGVKGGTEILVHTARLLLEANPSWACCSNDIVNGFNAVSRDAVLDALNADDRLRPLLLAVQRFYCREGGLLPVPPSCVLRSARWRRSTLRPPPTATTLSLVCSKCSGGPRRRCLAC